MKNIYFATLLIFLLASCGGSGGSSNPSQPPIPIQSSSSAQSSSSIQSSSSEQSSSSSSAPVTEKIDCTKLNPSKVYMLGTLSKSSSENFLAVADPANPLDFCIGFSNSYIYSAVISSEGKLIYANSTTQHFYQMVPDNLLKVPNDETSDPNDFLWQYPSSTESNDNIIFTSHLGCGLQYIKLMPLTNRIYYSCPSQIINTELVDNYYDLGSTSENSLLSVLPDGSLLVFTFEEKLKIVDASRNETVLTMPSSIPDPVCNSARQFIDDQTKEKKIWVECYDRGYYSSQNENLHRRYTVNIATKNIQDDGVFSPAPQGTRAFVDGKFDGEGNLWQNGDMYPTNPSINVVVKRPVKGKAAELIYTEAAYSGTGDWRKDNKPFVRLRNSNGLLITGY